MPSLKEMMLNASTDAPIDVSESVAKAHMKSVIHCPCEHLWVRTKLFTLPSGAGKARATLRLWVSKHRAHLDQGLLDPDSEFMREDERKFQFLRCPVCGTLVGFVDYDKPVILSGVDIIGQRGKYPLLLPRDERDDEQVTKQMTLTDLSLTEVVMEEMLDESPLPDEDFEWIDE